MKTAFINGKVYLSRGRFARAVLIEDEIITKVGEDAEVLALAGGGEVIDCEGRTVIPGFNDSHMHLCSTGQKLARANITGAGSIDDIVERCRKFLDENAHAREHGVFSSGWNQDLFTTGEKRYLLRGDLDRISTDVPVVLSRVCGHMSAANTKAIEMAGLTRDSEQIEGGLFEREADGFPSGFFAENACGIVGALAPDPDESQMEQLIVKAMEYAVSHGLTSVQSNDIGQSAAGNMRVFDMIARLYEQSAALPRYRHQLCFHSFADFEHYLATEHKNTQRYEKLKNRVALGPLKLFKDGSLGARTATVRREYLDDPGNFGVEVMSGELCDKMVALAAQNGMQVVTHAIGDKAVADMLDCYEKALAGGQNTLRHSIVHYQCLDPELIERTARMGVIAQVQPIFLTTDIHAVPSRFSGEMNRWFLAFKTYLQKGVRLSFGSDSPVEDCNPFLGVYCAVTRKDVSGAPADGFFPEECLDVETAIDCFTAGSAYCEFQEKVKGRIAEGMLGDMLILSDDIFTCNAEKIKEILPVRTIIGGKTVFQK